MLLIQLSIVGPFHRSFTKQRSAIEKEYAQVCAYCHNTMYTCHGGYTHTWLTLHLFIERVPSGLDTHHTFHSSSYLPHPLTPSTHPSTSPPPPHTFHSPSYLIPTPSHLPLTLLPHPHPLTPSTHPPTSPPPPHHTSHQGLQRLTQQFMCKREIKTPPEAAGFDRTENRYDSERHRIFWCKY